jgi:murein DD-endopeptidase MepM/ murein hydrolase activator NlpD
MANQPLALTGSSVREVVGGKAGPLKGFDIGGGNAEAATPASGDVLGNAQPGSPIAGQKPHASTHPTAGLPGYPAFDYMAPAGTPVVAPATGKIVQLSGHDPAMGPTNGPHGPFGWSIYIQAKDGTLYYLTHLGSRLVHLGQQVMAGQKIGTVGDYAKWGGASHVHQGVHHA